MSAPTPTVIPEELLFPGRKTLTVLEVAGALRVTDQHVFDLIDEGKIGAVNVGGGRRNHWRIPASEYLAFLKRAWNK